MTRSRAMRRARIEAAALPTNPTPCRAAGTRPAGRRSRPGCAEGVDAAGQPHADARRTAPWSPPAQAMPDAIPGLPYRGLHEPVGVSDRAILPPREIGRYPSSCRWLDADGMAVAGIRQPPLAAPRATYTGWKPAAEGFGAGAALPAAGQRPALRGDRGRHAAPPATRALRSRSATPTPRPGWPRCGRPPRGCGGTPAAAGRCRVGGAGRLGRSTALTPAGRLRSVRQNPGKVLAMAAAELGTVQLERPVAISAPTRSHGPAR